MLGTAVAGTARGTRVLCLLLHICWAQFAHRLCLQTATLSLQTGRFQRPVCRLGETLAQFANWVSVCKLRQPSLQTR